MTSNPLAGDDSSPEPFTITLDAHSQLPGLVWPRNNRNQAVEGGPGGEDAVNSAPRHGLEPLESWLLGEGIRPLPACHPKQKTRPVLSQAEDDAGMPSPIYLKLDSSSLSRLVVALNRCTVRHLSVTFTPPPTSSALLALLGTLEIRGLHTLQIFGKLSPDTVPILADYLASPRSAGLRVLRLDRGECTVRDLEPLADAIEANGSVQKVWTVSGYDAAPFVDLFSLMERPNPTGRLRLAFHRNKSLAIRVRKAVLSILPPARVFLRAQCTGDSKAPSSPIALLPLELVSLILQLASPDAYALQPSQWHALFAYSADSGRQQRTTRAMEEAVAEGRAPDAVIDEWLLCGGFWWAQDPGDLVPSSAS